MSWLKWLPWKFVIRRMARSQGFLDPFALMARLERFIQPSEVAEPIELLRAGAVFHARGLINSRVIQHNLDWVWPFWVERQFDPRDEAFVPRAFSITHVNLTHRNWTAVGVPGWPELPIVDPRGLLTPTFDGFSLDAWIVTDDGAALLPSRARDASQHLELGDAGPRVVTRTVVDGMDLVTGVRVTGDETPACVLEISARSERPAWLVLSVRPYNPEGVSFIQRIDLADSRDMLTIDGERHLRLSAPVDRHHVSDYRHGDVFIHLDDLRDSAHGRCDVEMATAAAMFRIEPGRVREVSATLDLPVSDNAPAGPRTTWPEALAHCCRLEAPDARWQQLYDAALHTLVLHSPHDVYAGPFTYKRFWFRDAAFIVNALLAAGLVERAERVIDTFPGRQNAMGYFHSQEGEWDSNGEALWIMDRFCELTGRAPKDSWKEAARRGARWIVRKRLPDEGGRAHSGLLPAGFSAEHLGPSDYYYWDDFWGVAGLMAASRLMRRGGDEESARRFRREAEHFLAAVERSIERAATRLGREAIPASPYRRLDAGAIGSLVAGYPLELLGADDPRLINTADYLIDNCFVDGGFFQDMIHSGINCYLTLHVAQVLLRAGDPRHLDLVNAVAAIASPTGQWPEAVHPRTGGGCMGDGQHSWAASEWLVMIRNGFVREDGDALVLAGGVPNEWLAGAEAIGFGPAPTAFGDVTLSITPRPAEIIVEWQADWRRRPAEIRVQPPGFAPVTADASTDRIVIQREEST